MQETSLPGVPPPAEASSASQARWCAPLALVLADVVALLAAVALAVVFGVGHGHLGAAMQLAHDGHLRPMLSEDALLLAGVLSYLHAKGHYSDRPPFWSALGQLLRASACALLAAGSIDVLLVRDSGMLLAPMLPWLLFPLLGLAVRLLARRGLHRLGLWQIPVLLVGEPDACDEVMQVFGAEGLPAFRQVGRIGANAYRRLAPAQAGRALLRQHGAARLVLGVDVARAESRDLIRSVTRNRVPFTVVPQTADLPVLGCSRTSFFSHDTVVLAYRSNLDQPLHRAVKIAMDLAVASALLVVLLPVFVILAGLIRLDGGAITFGHERVGIDGRRFRCLKFRSMVPDAAAVLQELLERDPEAAAEWRATHKLTSDPRITRIGQLLRMTSLDELPQLINVLRLDMSLVGPRPIVEAEQAFYGDDLVYYRSARPGITGLWQVSGRSNTSYERRVQLDCWYVRNWTVWHDVAILVKTVPAVLFREGAR